MPMAQNMAMGFNPQMRMMPMESGSRVPRSPKEPANSMRSKQMVFALSGAQRRAVSGGCPGVFIQALSGAFMPGDENASIHQRILNCKYQFSVPIMSPLSGPRPPPILTVKRDSFNFSDHSENQFHGQLSIVKSKLMHFRTAGYWGWFFPPGPRCTVRGACPGASAKGGCHGGTGRR